MSELGGHVIRSVRVFAGSAKKCLDRSTNS